MEQAVVISAIVVTILALNGVLLYYLRKVNGRDKQIADFISSNDNLIINEAQQKAKSIVAAATIRAKQTLTETDYLKEDLIKKMEMLLEEVAKKDINLLDNKSNEVNDWYKKLLESVKQEHAKKAQEAAESLEKIAEQQISDFSQIIKQETAQSEHDIAQRANAEIVKVKQDLEVYKTRKMQEVANQTNNLILQVTEEVLGKAISMDDHQKLILDALEKAKREGFFTAQA